MNEHLRQSGRTGRLVEKAVHQARCGFAVYVLVNERRHIGQVRDRIDEAWLRLMGPNAHGHGIKVETPDMLGNWDWDHMELRGAYPNYVVLLDHFLVELRIEKLQAEIKRLAEQVGRLYPLTV